MVIVRAGVHGGKTQKQGVSKGFMIKLLPIGRGKGERGKEAEPAYVGTFLIIRSDPIPHQNSLAIYYQSVLHKVLT